MFTVPVCDLFILLHLPHWIKRHSAIPFRSFTHSFKYMFIGSLYHWLSIYQTVLSATPHHLSLVPRFPLAHQPIHLLIHPFTRSFIYSIRSPHTLYSKCTNLPLYQSSDISQPLSTMLVSWCEDCVFCPHGLGFSHRDCLQHCLENITIIVIDLQGQFL